jgi:hypothetical protein
MHYSGTEVAKLVSQQKNLFHSIRPKMMFGSVSEHFANVPELTRCETYVPSLNALLQGTEVAEMVSPQKHPFHSITPKMMVGSVSKHFANIRDVKYAKLVFWS